METITYEVSTRELRGQLSDVLGRAMYAHERIGVTRNGKLAAVVVGLEDLELLEAFEMSQDVAAYRKAKANDDGKRVSLAELRGDGILRATRQSAPPCARELVGEEVAWRIRVGDYRVIDEVVNSQLLVTVIRAAHRREVYR